MDFNTSPKDVIKKEALPKDYSLLPVNPSLQNELKTVSDKCINCEFCKKECAFLQEYGKPKQIADNFDPSNRTHQRMAFECSLCGLCSAVCPVDINPSHMFLEIRREAVQVGNGEFSDHRSMIGYEKRGTSRRYSYYAFPKDCDTVLFPGCTLPGTRPDQTWALFQHLKKTIPSLGIVLDCCSKPSHDLGRNDYFKAMFGEMNNYFIKHGIRNVMVTCPNCYKIFDKYGKKLSVQTVYEHLANNGLPSGRQIRETVTVHDSCAVRYDASVHSAVRSLCKRQGLNVQEMPHSRKETLCCGEGGAVNCIAPDLAKKWGAVRKGETNGSCMITYCAGCAKFLGDLAPTSHILDLVFEPEAAMAGKSRVSRPPLTYLNRIRLKKKFKKTIDARITRERTFTTGEPKYNSSVLKRIAILVAMISVILAIRFIQAI